MVIATIMEISQWVLYDQTDVPASPPGVYPLHLRLFTNPWPEPAWRAEEKCPYLRTNLDMASMLPTPQRFFVWRLNALFFRDDRPLPLSATELYARTIIEFEINRKLYWRGPAWTCVSPLALFTTPKEAIPRVEKEIGIPWERIGASFFGKIDWDAEKQQTDGGLMIDRAEAFGVKAEIERNDDPDAVLAVYLDGPIIRPVM